MNKQHRPRVSKENYNEVMRFALVGDSFDVAMRRYRKRMHHLEIRSSNESYKDDELKLSHETNRKLCRDNRSLSEQVNIANENVVEVSRMLAGTEEKCQINLRTTITLRSECEKLRIIIVFLIVALLFVSSLLIV
jgi:hypothetical protein